MERLKKGINPYHDISNILTLKQFKTEQGVLIFSEPRSGSTWLMEILGKMIGDAVVNWEPFHPGRGVVPKYLEWSFRPHFKDKNEFEQHYELINKILSLSVFTPWTTQKIDPLKAAKANLVITKFVRANLILPWITDRFNLKYKPIYLVRHPISTCLSQLKTFKNLKLAFNRPTLINHEIFNEHIEFLKKLETELEYRIALWCIIHNKVIEGKVNLKNISLVYYEDLLKNPRTEINKLIENSGLDKLITSNIDMVNFKLPSSTVYMNDLEANVSKQINKHLEFIDKETKERIQGVLDYFSINIYNAYSPNPIKHGS
ncbi:sulfotransferase family protein [Snuella lapsa]|uniref:Sulfotransferase domain-containing protein n=1 Tax=Snuella lapsa TaxID=870481 RepID=A0ABP6XP13_9FLAO